MTDAELDALEQVAKAATPGPWEAWHAAGYPFLVQSNMAGMIDVVAESRLKQNSVYIAAANPAIILELIAELRQVRKERDWVIQNIRPTDCGPTACPTKEIWYNCDEGLKTPRNKDVCHKCWLKAAREATCQK